MIRIRLGARLTALVVLAPLAGGLALLHGCIPEADISGLPPFDAGVVSVIDGTTATDTGTDTSLPLPDAGDSGPHEGGGGGVTLTGVVLDYTEGLGRGVIPGATVTVLNGPTTTTDANGVFSLSGVAAGAVQLNVSKTIDVTNNLAYSTTQLVFNAAAGPTVVAPVLHRACIDRITFPDAGAQAGGTIATSTCNGRTGAVLSVKLPDSQSLVDVSIPSAPTPFTFGTARLEELPLEYPAIAQGAVRDLSWSVGLPGDGAPIDLLGAAEIRIVADANAAPLQLAAGKKATLTLPLYTAPAQGDTLQVWSFDAAAGKWVQENGIATPKVTVDQGSGLSVATFDVPHFTWWAVTRASTAKGCVKGILTAGGAPAAGVLVHGAGVDYLGASTAITDASGAFCLDVRANSRELVLSATVTPAGGFAVKGAPATPSGANGACSDPGQTACTDFKTMDMTALAPSCIAGTLLDGTGTAPATHPIEVNLINIPLDPAQRLGGISPKAYVGQIQPGDGGVFCTPVAPGTTTELVDPNDSECGGNAWAQLSVPQGIATAACGAAGCQDAGTIGLSCGSPP